MCVSVRFHLVPAQELVLWYQVVLRLHLLAHRLVLVWGRRVCRGHGGWGSTGWLGHRRGRYERYRTEHSDVFTSQTFLDKRMWL